MFAMRRVWGDCRRVVVVGRAVRGFEGAGRLDDGVSQLLDSEVDTCRARYLESTQDARLYTGTICGAKEKCCCLLRSKCLSYIQQIDYSCKECSAVPTEWEDGLAGFYRKFPIAFAQFRAS